MVTSLPSARGTTLQTRSLPLGPIIGFLILGSILRLIWPADMEWKADEIWMWEHTQQILNGVIPMPWVGMRTSLEVPNSVVGTWIFLALAKVSPTPVRLVQWIQGLNVLTLWGFLAFILFQVRSPACPTWLWGLAIASVNPTAILLARKLWLPDLIAPFCLLILIGHWFRTRFWGSLLWGTAVMLCGQIHMGGFFVAFGLGVWTVWQEWHKRGERTHWLGYAIGTLLGALPLIPWAITVIPNLELYREFVDEHESLNLFPRFYLQWLTSALGVNLSNALWSKFWTEFLAEPKVWGVPTYLMVPAHGFLAGIGLYPVYRWWCDRRRLSLKSVAPTPQINFYCGALAWGTGGLFSLLRVNVHSHYLAVVFPFPYLWLARLYRQRVWVLGAIALTQLLISVTFLVFIHRTGGHSFGETEYGLTYWMQQMQLEE
ncbi:MAG: hypothetical protein ACPGVO_09465 [Spirulinaceae cyanobacterium]